MNIFLDLSKCIFRGRPRLALIDNGHPADRPLPLSTSSATPTAGRAALTDNFRPSYPCHCYYFTRDRYLIVRRPGELGHKVR